MSNKIFTDDEIELLKNNQYVKNVSCKGITYERVFKKIFVKEYMDGLSNFEIFEKYGFDVVVLGSDRIKSSSSRWRAAYELNGELGLNDTRKENPGRPRTKDLTPEEHIARLKAKIALQDEQIKLLKKLDRKERSVKRTLYPSEIYEMIKSVIIENNLSNQISFLCKETGVSRSGYYRYWSTKAITSRVNMSTNEETRLLNIRYIFNQHKGKVGSKQIKMILENDFNIIYNLKSIKRIMRKYDLKCVIRKARPYAKQLKATKEHRTFDNVLERKFTHEAPYKTLLTDITYLKCRNKFLYLSVIMDSNTSEVLAYKLSESLKIDFVLDTILELDYSILHKDALIHSDQGVHYTSPKFSKLVSSIGLKQSMSRRGNCWDNAPMESFFGHFKDNVTTKYFEEIEDVKEAVDAYIRYYNNNRYQWNRKKMTPVQYRNHLIENVSFL